MKIWQINFILIINAFLLERFIHVRDKSWKRRETNLGCKPVMGKQVIDGN